MSLHITVLRATEILDSRARPTLSVTVGLAGGVVAHAGVPSGASTGSAEAVELRDGDTSRYGGQGVRKAVAHVNGEIADALRGRDFADQAELDGALIELDGTGNKSRLGANAVIGVSMAVARAAAQSEGVPLWQHLTPGGVAPRLPVPHFNVLNGGVHAPNPLDFQEFMIAPIGAPDMAEAVRAGAEVYGALRRRLADGRHSTGLGDEGGFAPYFTEPEEALEVIVAAIGDAGYTAGRDGVAIALDPAASEFRRPDGTYRVNGKPVTSEELIQRYRRIVEDFPVWSLEDGLGEDDHGGWVRLTAELGDRVQLVGDDNFVTNPTIIAQAVRDGIANASLVKLNQIGTVTETLRALALCRESGYGAMISHRSGETEDSFIADLAVGSGCGQLKSGAPARGERVAKYNRLLEIAARHPELPYGLDR
ncbi:phosphopyruvate hydratase [Streptomyces sp. PTM05]|uniref:Enolase n=1 Tax=Streptantibioticus parmotrematis TaxID=2873249 RepID=A0ABS7QQM4_9ACTN|nr:phosphopyruvate hydratase [Streptantibioticus parmotrematis]MBY8885506.1 phosphopyruvate hydratase [Streptantibioticus parmotrematis]